MRACWRVYSPQGMSPGRSRGGSAAWGPATAVAARMPVALAFARFPSAAVHFSDPRCDPEPVACHSERSEESLLFKFGCFFHSASSRRPPVAPSVCPWDARSMRPLARNPLDASGRCQDSAPPQPRKALYKACQGLGTTRVWRPCQIGWITCGKLSITPPPLTHP